MTVDSSTTESRKKLPPPGDAVRDAEPRPEAEPRPDPEAEAEPECDLIMKGGITSGVAYPLGVAHLATRYRLRNIGGTSAGAIAAGLAAAAEYQRRQAHLKIGIPTVKRVVSFPKLKTLPNELGTELATLFQPAPSLSRVYKACSAWAEPDWGRFRKGLTTLAHLFLSAPLRILITTILALIPAFLVGQELLLFLEGRSAPLGGLVLLVGALVLVGCVAAALICGFGVGIWATGGKTLAALKENGYGFCSGMPEAHKTPSELPLTPWLTDWIDEVADRSTAGSPLTFGHLYGEDASKVFKKLNLDNADAALSPKALRTFKPDINLQVMTTCLTWGRPYVFPFRTRVFYYCPRCWRNYFPERVMEHLDANSRAVQPKAWKTEGCKVEHSDVKACADPNCTVEHCDFEQCNLRHEDVEHVINVTCPDHVGEKVRTLPSTPDIPVIVAVRLSLSFPILISAVPMFTIDYNRTLRNQKLVKIWFSDGGLTSNFPIHFFDSLLPTRPTFGINLTDVHPDHQESLTYRPTKASQGLTYRVRDFETVQGFIGALVHTVRSWTDGMALDAPGFRDRIVDLAVKDGEGGLNLKMTEANIRTLAELHPPHVRAHSLQLQVQVPGSPAGRRERNETAPRHHRCIGAGGLPGGREGIAKTATTHPLDHAAVAQGLEPGGTGCWPHSCNENHAPCRGGELIRASPHLRCRSCQSGVVGQEPPGRERSARPLSATGRWCRIRGCKSPVERIGQWKTPELFELTF